MTQPCFGENCIAQSFYGKRACKSKRFNSNCHSGNLKYTNHSLSPLTRNDSTKILRDDERSNLDFTSGRSRFSFRDFNDGQEQEVTVTNLITVLSQIVDEPQ